MKQLTLAFALGDTVQPIDTYNTLLFNVTGILVRKDTIQYELESYFPEEGLQLKVASNKIGIANSNLVASYTKYLREQEDIAMEDMDNYCECCGHVVEDTEE